MEKMNGDASQGCPVSFLCMVCQGELQVYWLFLQEVFALAGVTIRPRCVA